MSGDRYAVAARYAAMIVAAAGLTMAAGRNIATAQSTNFDGVYAGTQTLTENGSVANYSKCLRGPFKRKLVIKGNIVSYVYNPTYQGTVTGTISVDGNVLASEDTPSGGVRLSGRIEGDNFKGQVWSLYCTYTLDLKRTP